MQNDYIFLFRNSFRHQIILPLLVARPFESGCGYVLLAGSTTQGVITSLLDDQLIIILYDGGAGSRAGFHNRV
jgi:hypothetical protein